MMNRELIIVNVVSYPIRVMIGFDPDNGLEKFRSIKPLGRLGPIEIDSLTYEHLKLNPNVRLLVI